MDETLAGRWPIVPVRVLPMGCPSDGKPRPVESPDGSPPSQCTQTLIANITCHATGKAPSMPHHGKMGAWRPAPRPHVPARCTRDPMAEGDGESTIDLELLTLALEQAGDSVEILDSELKIRWVNEAFERLHGRRRSEVIGLSPSSLALGSKRFAARHAEAERAIAEGRRWIGEIVAARPDGSEVMVEMTVSPVREPSGRNRGCVAVKRDLTPVRALAFEQHRHGQELETILNSVPVGVVVHHEGVLRYVNRHVANMLGVPADELLGRSIHEFVHPDDQEGVQERFALTARGGGVPNPTELRVSCRQGKVIPVRVHPVGQLAFRGEDCLCACLEDLGPERKRRESSILEDRMQTIGQIAAGVAHEINNPLTWMIDALD
ncbi:MAG TPA: PAS domain-containing sensor histidine kinase, partial [Polyangiaceae bacterium]|nr:PAS domain-containing sensor histidine kinase [Polyangiaceae bacterium]